MHKPRNLRPGDPHPAAIPDLAPADSSPGRMTLLCAGVPDGPLSQRHRTEGNIYYADTIAMVRSCRIECLGFVHAYSLDGILTL
jgi:hypothetical protein